MRVAVVPLERGTNAARRDGSIIAIASGLTAPGAAPA